ncbi:MAG: uncharacterized protein JWR07_3683 [Nevskia sp.]|nr:uncharacterized protein [Nevskia sp.]
MSATPIVISRTGLVTGVGLDAPATCAAIRGAIDNFQETRFQDGHGEWLMGCEVPLPEPWRGEARLIKMAARAITECLDGFDCAAVQSLPCVLCLAEPERCGRIVRDDGRFFVELELELGLKFAPQSTVIAEGHVSAAAALRRARELIRDGGAKHVLIAACDSLLVGATLADLERHDRIMTSQYSDGFIAGEGAAALLVEGADARGGPQLTCTGLGFAHEKAHIDSEEPLRADGLTAAIKQSLADAGCGESILGFKIIDASGGQYAFKEATLAFGRIDRTKRQEFDVWHPADCIGEVGASIGLVMIAVLKAACEKAYSKGNNVLLHLGNDDGRRASMIFSWIGARQ